jgi:hypothetical protein
MTSTVGINGTTFVNDPIGTAFSPFTNIFQQLVGNGNIFYLVILIALTLGIWYKTDEPIMASMFMLGSGAILGAGTLTIGMESLGIMFTIFSAIGLTILVVSLILERRG